MFLIIQLAACFLAASFDPRRLSRDKAKQKAKAPFRFCCMTDTLGVVAASEMIFIDFLLLCANETLAQSQSVKERWHKINSFVAAVEETFAVVQRERERFYLSLASRNQQLLL